MGGKAPLDAIAVTGVGLDQAGVDGKTLAADTALQDGFEQPAQQIALATNEAVSGGWPRILSNLKSARRHRPGLFPAPRSP